MRQYLLGIVVLLAGLAGASAQPQYYQGHYYSVIEAPGGINWWDAKAAAESSVYAGASGHLAAITSQGETDFLNGLFAGESGSTWIGGYQPPGSDEPAGGWEWITAEACEYTNWHWTEPNDGAPGGEDALSLKPAIWGKQWNDAESNQPLPRYIIEYDSAQPPYYYEGHYYNVIQVPEGINWWDAKAAAEASVHNGLSGHLATITSQGETDFVNALFAGESGSTWIGGYQPPGSDEPEGGWEWITAEPWEYTNWHGTEPNDGAPGEDALSLKPAIWGKQWNDGKSNQPLPRYVVEYDEYDPIPLIPGDSNRDGVVDDLDLTALVTHWQQYGGLAEGDFNGDGFVSDSDLTILATTWPEPPPGPGDANGDGVVDDLDLTALVAHWEQYGDLADGDFNGDGFISQLDLTVLATAWPSGTGAPEDVSAIPEPATLSLLALLALSLPKGGCPALVRRKR